MDQNYINCVLFWALLPCQLIFTLHEISYRPYVSMKSESHLRVFEELNV
jgi:hypothetical protein